MRSRGISALLVFVVGLWAGFGHAEDLRNKYGTTSSQCANAVGKAIEMVQARNPRGALGQAQQAVKHDPTCVMAWYWLATASIALGDVEKGIEQFKKTVDVSLQRWGGKIDNIGADACINIGLTLIQLDEIEQAKYWFSREILLDPDDVHKLHWKAYRNMSIATFNGGDPLSATMQVMRAKEAAPNRVEDKMIGEFQSQIGNEVGFTVLTPFENPPVAQTGRSHKCEMKRLPKLEEALNAQSSVTGMTHGFESNLILVYSNSDSNAMLVSSAGLKTKQIKMPAPVRKAKMSGKTILALAESGTTLYEIPWGGGKSKSHQLSGVAADMDYCSRTNQAFLCIAGEIMIYNLGTGKTVKTDLAGQLVVCDPANQLVYSAYKVLQQRGSNHVIVGGRPIFFNNTPNPNDDLDLLFQGVYNAAGKITISAVREKAAWNGFAMDVSRDGALVTVTGGGGYRGPGGRGGYGTGVFPTSSLGRLAGFYPCDAYSNVALFNPATPQIAVMGTSNLNVFDLGGAEPAFSEKAKFKKVACWSPDGTLLLAYVDKEGVRAYANSISTAERDAYAKARKKTFPKVVSVGSSGAATGVAPRPIARKRSPIPALTRFKPVSTLATAVAAAKKAAAIDHVKSEGMPRWRDTGLYDAPDTAVGATRKIRDGLNDAQPGISLFRTKKLLRAHPNYLPAVLLQGELLLMTGQRDLAVEPLLAVLHKDAGRSDLSSQALLILGQLYQEDRRDAQALHCYATGLQLDAGHQRTRQAAAALFRKHGAIIAGQKGTPPQQVPAGVMAVGDAGIKPPAKHVRSSTSLKSEKIYGVSVVRTVTIQTNDGHGSGVCITEQGHILTCSHVVEEGSGEIRVNTYVLKDGKAVKSDTVTATVVYRDRARDVAVLKPNKQVKSLRYFSLAKTAVKPGQRVFAVGSPGMGRQQLTQSLSEGVVSAAERVVDGQQVIQHTAAVNPGNSGGPLISERGEVVGMVVIKAHLENVAFAVPAHELRESIGWK